MPFTSAKTFSDESTDVVAAPKPEEIAEAADKETVDLKNVSGSCAGAGSGDFHQYRNARRREMDRLEKIEELATKSEKEREFQERKAARQAELEEKMAKKRAKRQKRKHNKSQASANNTADGPENSDGNAQGQTVNGTAAVPAGSNALPKLQGKANPSLPQVHSSSAGPESSEISAPSSNSEGKLRIIETDFL